jgi:hypothetical protein
MKFCEICNRCLDIDTSTGYVKKKCRCGREYEGTANDSLIFSSFQQTSGGIDLRVLLRFAAEDRVNQQVGQPCTCGRKYMTLAGSETGFWLVCDGCGRQLDGSKMEIDLRL